MISQIEIPDTGSGRVEAGRTGELTRDRKNKLFDDRLVNAKTGGIVNLLKRNRLKGKIKLSSSKRYENIIRDNWSDYIGLIKNAPPKK
jgi:hypothetical protein